MNELHEIRHVSKLKRGDVKSFDVLFYHYNERLYYFVFSLIKKQEDAEGIVQEVFLKIWTNRRSIDLHKSFKSYVFTIAYNLTIDYLRKRIHENEYIKHLENHFNVESISVENEGDFNIVQSQVEKFIEELPKRRQQIFKLSRINGLSHKEIASRLNISVKTVENHISLAIKHLKEKLKFYQPTILLIFLPFL
jgi:RNA polymerase sigma-70 factor (ECF subfamily)